MKKNAMKIILAFIASLIIQQFMESEARACNVAVVTASASATGRPFIWKNRDHADSYRHEVLYFPEVIPGVGGSVRLLGETAFNNSLAVCTGGTNESGFAIANTTCWESLLLEAANVNTNFMELALERCRTLADFEGLAAQFTSLFSNKNKSGIFAVIDAYNGAAIYEMWTNGNGKPIIYRKFDANTGYVTDENGLPFNDYRYTQTVGFNNRTNSNHTNGWIEIQSDSPREERARQLMTQMLVKHELSPRNLMREVAKDVCGGNPADYCLTDWVRNKWNFTIDSYHTPNRSGEMYTRFCISRYQTSMGLVIEGAASPEEADLTTMWAALGEPSLSVFVPFFPAAGDVSKYAWHNQHSNSGYYWDGSSSTQDNEDNSFLNLLFDCVQANPFGSGHVLYDTYRSIALYKNNGSGNYYDSQDRNNGEIFSILTGTYKMDTTFTYPRLMTLQNWTLPLEDHVYDRIEEYVSLLRANPALITSQRLAELSDYACRFVYANYSNQSSAHMLWGLAIPDNGMAPTIATANIGQGGSNFPVSGVITVTFSEPMNEDTLDVYTFSLWQGTTRVDGTVVYDAATLTATFYPSSALQYGTTYRVELTNDIRDLAGTRLANYSWTFTTAAQAGGDPEDPGDPENPIDPGTNPGTGEPIDPGSGGTFPPINNVTKSSSNSDSGGCGSVAEASTLAGGARPFMPGFVSLLVTMVFPLALTMLHRRARRRRSE